MKLVSIVLAIYKPNYEYFNKQLDSLNIQTYPKIEIIIRDDSADEKVFNEIKEIIEEKITKFKYVILKNDFNIGSNKTFERLTEYTRGTYIAYCDQDDIWEKEKITKLVEEIEKEDSTLCYSDLSIIDSNDNFIAKSFKNINKRLVHVEGQNLFEFYLRRNSVTGCTMLIRSEIAKSAIPFCNDYFVHDHWLALWASTKGNIAYVNEPLIRYRIHGNNQIGASMLLGIDSKLDYLNKKLLKEKEKYDYLLSEYKFNDTEIESIKKLREWTIRRISFFESNNSFKNIYLMLKTIREDWQLIIFEIIIKLTPEGIVERILNKIKS